MSNFKLALYNFKMALKRFMRPKSVKICVFLVCFLLIAPVVLFFSCEGFQDMVFDIGHKHMKEHVSYTYEVVYDFEDMADRPIIEERLAIFEFEILSKKQDGSCYIYSVDRYYQAADKFFEVISTDNEKVEMVDTEGKPVLSKSDVVSVKMDFYGNAIVKVNEECYQRFLSYDEEADFYLTDGKEKTKVFFIIEEDNTLKLFVLALDMNYMEKDNVMFHQGIINLVSDPLIGKVKARVLDENVSFK